MLGAAAASALVTVPVAARKACCVYLATPHIGLAALRLLLKPLGPRPY